MKKTFIIIFLFFLNFSIYSNPLFHLKKEFSKLTNKRKSKEVIKKIKLVEKNLIPDSFIEENKSSRKSLRRQMKSYKIDGVSISLINNNTIEWSKNYGKLNNKRITDDTLYNSKMMTKPLFALASLYLSELAKLKEEDEISNLIDVKKDTITLKKLLSYEKSYNSLGIFEITENNYLTNTEPFLKTFLKKLSEKDLNNFFSSFLEKTLKMKNSKYFEKISENLENFDFISTNTNEIATFIINLQHSYKNDSKFSNELLQKIMHFGDVKNSKTPIFAINLYEKDFSCLIISFLNEDKGAIIITNSEKGKDFSLEILRSIDSVYNWNTFTPEKKTCSPQDKIHKN